jgi:mutator protein MutT
LSSRESGPVVHVVAAAVIDAAGRVLIAQRPSGTHLAGGWEFPGGKLEPGEERAAGLARELKEELGISIAAPRPLIRVQHAYPSRVVLLDMWVVKRYTGEPRGLDGQALRWCAQEDLAAADLLPADKPIVAALRLPERLTQITTLYYAIGHADAAVGAAGDAVRAAGAGQLRGVFCASAAVAAAAAALAGADFLVLVRELPDEQVEELCRSVPMPVYARGIPLQSAWGLGASGINEITA